MYFLTASPVRGWSRDLCVEIGPETEGTLEQFAGHLLPQNEETLQLPDTDLLSLRLLIRSLIAKLSPQPLPDFLPWVLELRVREQSSSFFPMLFRENPVFFVLTGSSISSRCHFNALRNDELYTVEVFVQVASVVFLAI